MLIKRKEEMKNHTSFKIGGIVDIFAEPENIEELIELIKFLRENDFIYYICGNGTNLLVADKGIRGVVVHIGQNISNIKLQKSNKTKIEVEPGATMAQISDFCIKNGLKGFEPLSGIPGTIGGAIAMNASAYQKEIKDLVDKVDVLEEDGKINQYKKDELEFDYRQSIIDGQNKIVTRVILSLESGDPKEIEENVNKYRELRNKKQPVEHLSAGSTFKRPKGDYASRLIDECGLKGAKVGDAVVSDKHAGFIINTGNAKASDVLKLMDKIKESVNIYYGVMLEPEYRIWGKF